MLQLKNTLIIIIYILCTMLNNTEAQNVTAIYYGTYGDVKLEIVSPSIGREREIILEELIEVNSIKGKTSFPNIAVFQMYYRHPRLNRPMFPWVKNRRYLFIIEENRNLNKVKHFKFDGKEDKLNPWQFGQNEFVTVCDLDETPVEKEYKTKITSYSDRHIPLSSLKDIEDKVSFWQNKINNNQVPFSDFIKEMGLPWTVELNNNGSTLVFDYLYDIENIEDVDYVEKDNPDVIVRIHPQIIVFEQNGKIVRIEKRFTNRRYFFDPYWYYRDLDPSDL